MIRNATRRAQAFKDHYDNTLLESDVIQTRVNGFLAEEAIMQTYPMIRMSQDRSYDLLFGLITIEVKAIGCNSKPLPHYNATIFEYQKPKADYLAFARVKNDHTCVWLIGYIKTKDFYKKATLRLPGHQTPNGQTYEYPRYEIQYSDLKPAKVK